ncbi:glycosyltransferase family 4 protein [Roseisalinus antarcticus]|uniref:Glycosyl transferases group 1 n=1 Tax=Roseisalinus antarcticus TaxID=254357 RepID=A0A1Y5TPK1_9RHOB|nr:glycosyltransferase [Roseisalinus antarcticus]SLN68942.1 hypothetical protein ROA7023_03341 [Roseisalinus antarcticus]
MKQPSRGEVDEVHASDLFDAEWYLAEYPDVALLKMNPIVHYLRFGGPLGRRPAEWFDPDAYRAEYPEVDEEGVDPFLHYIRINRPSDATGTGTGTGAARPDRDGDGPPLPEPAGGPLLSAPLPEGTVPHYGAKMQRLAGLARAAAPPSPEPDDYETVMEGFDHLFYLTRYHDMAAVAHRSNMVRHYLRAGAKEGRDPSPHFSTKGYLARYPDQRHSPENPFAHWLRRGRAEGQIATPLTEFDKVSQILGHESPAATQEMLIARRRDLRERFETGKLGEMVRKATAHEPLVGQVWPQALQPNIQPLVRQDRVRMLAALGELHEMAGARTARAVVAVNAPRWGGGRRMEGHITHALAEMLGVEEVILMVTDKGGEMADSKAPPGVRYVDFASATASLSKPNRERMLFEFLRGLAPEAVFNINSLTIWTLMTNYPGPVSASLPIVGCFFCNDQNRFGHWGGYPASQFYRHFDKMRAVCPDSHYLADQLATQFAVPPEQRHKIAVLEGPVDPSLPVASAPAPGRGRRPQFFWASRLDDQKRLDVVYAIARAMPDVDIRMWGAPVASQIDPRVDKPGNVILEGVYDSFAALPLGKADGWLYTSEWDGVPSILLEVAMTGIPMVGSLVGGCGEVLREGLSWPIADFANPDAYVDAMRALLADPEGARARALQLREALVAERTPEAYAATLAQFFEGTAP